MIEDKKKNDNILIIVLVIAMMIIVGLVGYICYDKGVIFASYTSSDKKNLNSNNKVKDEKKDSTSKENSSSENEKEGENNASSSDGKAKRCSGTYSGETSGTLSNGLSYSYKYVYTLSLDGTYTSVISDSASTTGVYVINDNTISFIGRKNNVGPREEDPYYTTSDYVIADDCSYIRVVSDTGNFNLNKH